MKKVIITIFILLIPFCEVSAIQRCVQLQPSASLMTCSSYGTYSSNADWLVKCQGITGGDFYPYGIATCSSDAGTIGSRKTTLSFDSGAEKSYCWCKMVYPAISKYWVNYSSSKPYTEAECLLLCGRACAAGMINNSSFRGVLITSGLQ